MQLKNSEIYIVTVFDLRFKNKISSSDCVKDSKWVQMWEIQNSEDKTISENTQKAS